MEEYTVRFLNAVSPHLSRVPPPYYVGALLGIINSCLFYLGFGRSFRLFLPYLAWGRRGRSWVSRSAGKSPTPAP